MSIISRMRKQDAVFWELDSFDEFGKPVLLSPVEIKCRWEDVSEEYMDSKGDKRISSSLVYVDRDTKAGGILFLGFIVDVPNLSDPISNEGAFEIRRFEKLPNVRNTENLLTVRL